MQEKVLLWFSLHALDAWWFIGPGQARAQPSERVPCEDETQEVCWCRRLKVIPVFCLPGSPEVGESVFKEGMARQSDRRTRRSQVSFPNTIRHVLLQFILSLRYINVHYAS